MSRRNPLTFAVRAKQIVDALDRGESPPDLPQPKPRKRTLRFGELGAVLFGHLDRIREADSLRALLENDTAVLAVLDRLIQYSRDALEDLRRRDQALTGLPIREIDRRRDRIWAEWVERWP